MDNFRPNNLSCVDLKVSLLSTWTNAMKEMTFCSKATGTETGMCAFCYLFCVRLSPSSHVRHLFSDNVQYLRFLQVQTCPHANVTYWKKCIFHNNGINSITNLWPVTHNPLGRTRLIITHLFGFRLLPGTQWRVDQHFTKHTSAFYFTSLISTVTRLWTVTPLRGTPFVPG